MWFKKSDGKSREALEDMHHPETITKRLQAANHQSNLGDALLGGIDGCVTTFAIVAGVVGGGFGSIAALALGLSSLVADGFSMAVSNYHAAKTKFDNLEQTRLEEHHHIEVIPEGEREEIRQIFANKGFEGDILDEIVKTITSNKELWVDTMIQEEHGLPLEENHPFRSAVVTFFSFIVVGLMPLLPFFYIYANVQLSFQLSCVATTLSFLTIGIIKGSLLKQPIFKEALSVLLMGGSAAGLAYGISYFVSQYFGAFI